MARTLGEHDLEVKPLSVKLALDQRGHLALASDARNGIDDSE